MEALTVSPPLLSLKGLNLSLKLILCGPIPLNLTPSLRLVDSGSGRLDFALVCKIGVFSQLWLVFATTFWVHLI